MIAVTAIRNIAIGNERVTFIRASIFPVNKNGRGECWRVYVPIKPPTGGLPIVCILRWYAVMPITSRTKENVSNALC